MNYEQIKPYIEKKLVSEGVHPHDPNVRIFNYTQHCQFEQAWDDITRQCRGLIMNVATGEILAKPFPKFFNYGEHISKGWPIPTSKPEIYEKLDGSLGILYSLNGKSYVATRGSFSSVQAIWATYWWRDNFGDGEMAKQYTHLFEIIYPENRIVVNYDFSGLVYLGSLDTKTGQSFILNTATMFGKYIRTASPMRDASLVELASIDSPNAEGFVVFYPEENIRMKIKFPEYVRLHKLVTGVNEIAIWEHLRDGKGFEDLLEKVPDEFYQWVTEVSTRLNDAFQVIADECVKDFNELMEEVGDMPAVDYRKNFAILTRGRKHPSVLFAMLDNKEFSSIIWRVVRPRGDKVFKNDIDL